MNQCDRRELLDSLKPRLLASIAATDPTTLRPKLSGFTWYNARVGEFVFSFQKPLSRGSTCLWYFNGVHIPVWGMTGGEPYEVRAWIGTAADHYASLHADAECRKLLNALKPRPLSRKWWQRILNWRKSK